MAARRRLCDERRRIRRGTRVRASHRIGTGASPLGRITTWAGDLKIIAWADRHMENNKDAADLYKILTTYHSAGNENRIYDQEPGLLERVAYDPTLVGAQLLGRDAARISNSVAAGQIGNLLSSEAQTDLLISHMITTASYEDNAASVARTF